MRRTVSRRERRAGAARFAAAQARFMRTARAIEKRRALRRWRCAYSQARDYTPQGFITHIRAADAAAEQRQRALIADKRPDMLSGFFGKGPRRHQTLPIAIFALAAR